MSRPSLPSALPSARRLVARALHLVWRFTRPLTGGVRAMVLDGDDVLLVRHTYVPGWHLPGGGVEPGETFEEAVRKELREEAAVRVTGRPRLHAIYLNITVTRRDHVALYVVRGHERGAFEPTREIAEAAFHPVAALPEGTTDATRRRIAEVIEGREPDTHW